MLRDSFLCLEFASSWSTSSSVSSSRVLREDYSLLPVVLAGIFGTGFVEAAYADNGAVDVQESAKKERERIEELLRSRGIRYGSYPRFTVYVKGQKVQLQPLFFFTHIESLTISDAGITIIGQY